jgi:AcrR family transcriptional regulator
MKRKRRYTLKRRADNQAETRRTIVEATIALHTEIGPARTSISAIAERAGVQRHTVYAHFPIERDLHLACSGLALERDPLPNEGAWLAVPAGEARLHRGLSELYAWFARNKALAGSVLRDAEIDPMTRNIVDLRMGSRMRAIENVLAQGLRPGRERRAVLSLALSFHTWRSLTEDGGLSGKSAVDLMVRAIGCAGG